MQTQIRVSVRGIVHHADIGEDQGIDTEIGRLVDGPFPDRERVRLRVGVDGDVDLHALCTCVVQSLTDLPLAEIQAGEMAGVGFVAKTDIYRIGAIIDGGFKRRQVAGRADEFHGWAIAGLRLID